MKTKTFTNNCKQFLFVDVPQYAKNVEVDYSQKLHCSTFSYLSPTLHLLHIDGKASIIGKVAVINEHTAEQIIAKKDKGYLDYRDYSSESLPTAKQSLLSLCQNLNVDESSWILTVTK